jgi:hypothetical protein
MKTILFLAVSLLASVTLPAQLKTTAICPAMVVDVLGGRVSNLPANSTAGMVKSSFPCYTSATESTAPCGAAVMFKDKDIYFYSGRNYVEIGPRFKGKMSIPIMGAARNALFKWLGLPKIKDVKWDAYQTQYGTLILYFSSANKVNKIQFSTLSTEQIKLCE